MGAAFALLAALLLTSGQSAHGQAQAAPEFPQIAGGDKRITGVVRDAQGKPVAGIFVGLSCRWSQIRKTGETESGSRGVGHVLTDVQGRFTFSGLPAGRFDYEVSSPANLYVPIEAPLVLGEGDTVKVLPVVVSAGSLVTGRVVDGQLGKPIAHVGVGAGPIPPGGDLAQWTFWAMPSTAVTDAQGDYRVRVAPGSVFVGVGRMIFSGASSRRIRYAAQKVSVRPGQTAAAPDIAVFLHGMIVCVGPDGHPVANTNFREVPDDLNKNGYIVDARTDDAGAVALADFDSGTFSIGQNGRTASGKFLTSPTGALTITMDGHVTSYADGVGTVRLADGSAAVIVGSVLSESDQPIPNARVRVIELDPNGEYQAYIRADGFNQVSVSDKPLSVEKGRVTNLGVFHLLRANGSISGRVVDSLGKPMSGVLAFVRGGKTFLSSAVTDEEGRFRIPNVVPGELVQLELCLHGESPDSGVALSQSNDEMDIPGVESGPTEREIVWHPHP